MFLCWITVNKRTGTLFPLIWDMSSSPGLLLMSCVSLPVFLSISVARERGKEKRKERGEGERKGEREKEEGERERSWTALSLKPIPTIFRVSSYFIFQRCHSFPGNVGQKKKNKKDSRWHKWSLYQQATSGFFIWLPHKKTNVFIHLFIQSIYLVFDKNFMVPFYQALW